MPRLHTIRMSKHNRPNHQRLSNNTIPSPHPSNPTLNHRRTTTIPKTQNNTRIQKHNNTLTKTNKHRKRTKRKTRRTNRKKQTKGKLKWQ